MQHLREALVRYKYPRWAINKIQNKFINNNQEGDGNNNIQVGNTPHKQTTTLATAVKIDPPGEDPI